MHTYIKQLRWAHRFLRMDNSWDTGTLRQVCRGKVKSSAPPRAKLALLARDVQKLVSLSLAEQDQEQCALYAVGRHCVFRMPSECIPLELDGEHSSVVISKDELVVTLMRRKTSRTPSVIKRSCCCVTAGRRLCALHLFLPVVDVARSCGRKPAFTKSYEQFMRGLRRQAAEVGIP